MTSFPRQFGFAILLGAALFAAGCGGALYSVKSPVVSPLPDSAASGSDPGVEIDAAAMFDDDESHDVFGVNMLMSGILPVRIEMVNSGWTAIDVGQAKFALQDGDGKQWKARSAKQAAERVLKYYDVYLYNPSSRKLYLEAMKLHDFDHESPLGPGERRTGFVFFQSPGKEQIDRPVGLVMLVQKLPQTVEVKLN
ncbi:MAG: hypothetical protein ABIP75_03755 [Pyrinomonadaceae bacterium]